MRIEELNDRFGIPGAVAFDEGQGGLMRMSIAAAGAEAEIYLLGGHVTGFRPAGCEPVLWVSSRSPFAIGQPIRGGVPVCHPWFAEKADTALLHYLDEVDPEQIRIGMRVKAKFADQRTGGIGDIAHFRPAK